MQLLKGLKLPFYRNGLGQQMSFDKRIKLLINYFSDCRSEEIMK
jgi:hypothetical protein